MEDRGPGDTPVAYNVTANCARSAKEDGWGRREGYQGGDGHSFLEGVQ